MEAYWEPCKTSECDSLQAEVVRCVYLNNTINILFKGSEVDEDNVRDKIEGQVSFDVTQKGKQVVEGRWIYPDTVKQVARFTEREKESEDIIFKSKVTGILTIDKNSMEFIGIWDDEIWDKEDGCIYDFEVYAEIE
ncbi:MAG: hypothetical protein L3J51_09250 [Cocleimonas sp.]|nr:hypothetical protein [Cocleimonas sp.]